MINELITVVSVTFNNRDGLIRTLDSLTRVATKPKAVVVIDGGSTDGTEAVVDRYRQDLAIRFVSDRDDGIYDAMNKSRIYVTTELVHYLNGGDELWGDPYRGVVNACRFPVEVHDPILSVTWRDYVKLAGFGYCHQGLVFRAGHTPYDVRYEIAADFDLIASEFPDGVGAIPLVRNGLVRYYLGGVSTIKRGLGRSEIFAVAWRRFGIFVFIRLALELFVKELIPLQMRRRWASFLFGAPSRR